MKYQPIPASTPYLVVAANDASEKAKLSAHYSGGLVCDNVSDEVTIDSALTTVRAAGGGIVHMAEGTFTFGARLLQNFNASTNNNPIILEGEGDATIIDASAITAEQAALNFWGLKTATTSDLTNHADEGTNQVVLSAGHGLVAGDWIMIEDTTAIGQNVMADIHQILSATADTLTLTENLFFTYTVAKSAKVTKLVMVPNLVLRNFKIIGANASHHGGVLVSYGLNPRTENITCIDTSYYGVRFDNTVFGKDIGGKRDYIDWTGYGYGTLFLYACRSCQQVSVTVTNSVKGITIGGGGGSAPGIARFCGSYHNQGSDLIHGFETHGEDADSDFINNTIANCYGHPFSPNGLSARIIGNTVKNHDNNGTSSDAAVWIGDAETISVIIEGNNFHFNPASTSVQKWGVRIGNTATALTTFVCRNNTFSGYAAGQSVVEGVTATNRSVGDNISVGDVTADSLTTHAADTSTHGASDIADVSDIAVDANLSAAAQAAITASHAKQHAITATADHTSTATSGQMLKADANGLPIDATNTDTDVADAVTKKHAQNTDTGPAASLTVVGMAEIATAAETTTGTDATRTVSPDGLAGSDYGKRAMLVKLIDDATALATGDGKFIFVVPALINGWNLVGVEAHVTTVSSSGTPTYSIYNLTDSQDMLSVSITIDANEYTSATADTAPTINTTYDDVATGDRIEINKDVAGTGEKGDEVLLIFQLP